MHIVKKPKIYDPSDRHGSGINPHDMGIYVFNPKAEGGATAKMCWFYNIEGFAYKSDISADGKYIVVLEGPFDIDPDRIKENIVGKHRLIILS